MGPCREKIIPETTVLSLSLNGKPDKVLKYNELPYSIPPGPAMATTGSNFLAQLSSWFTKQHDEQLDKQVKVLVNKAGDGRKPHITILEDNRQQLIAGKRELFITWQSGKPPFTVTIKGHKKWAFPNLSQRQLQQSLELKPGPYQLILTDAGQKTVKYHFRVVDSQPQSLLFNKLRDSMDEKTQLIAQMLCLAIQDKGIWRFEAVQQMTPQVGNNAAAQILRDALLDGSEISVLDIITNDCRGNL